MTSTEDQGLLESSTSFGRFDPMFAASHFQSRALKTQHHYEKAQDVCEEEAFFYVIFHMEPPQ